ncbi:NADH-quinone oxidoreductase subunit D-related protein, partial [Escherichia coli]
YYLTSDGRTRSYHTRSRTPSYAHVQQIPAASRGSRVSDLIVYLGSLDFVMSDVDRYFCPRINTHKKRLFS